MAEDDFLGSHNYTFKSERLLFRPLRIDDTSDVFAFRSDPRVYYWLEPQTEVSESRAWIESRLKDKNCLNFCLEELSATEDNGPKAAKPAVVGLCGGVRLPEIGYMFLPRVWGKGYATEALRRFLQFYWNTFLEGHPAVKDEERNYLSAVTGPKIDSAASIAVLKKCGFEHWEDFEEENTLKPGEMETLHKWRLWRPSSGQ